jgi:branched-chain amino acid transport system substrate-binding protein
MKRLLTLVLLLSLTAFLALAGGQQEGTAAAEDAVVIGIYEPMTGPYAAGGQMTMEGVNFAHELRGEVLGKTIEMPLVDNKSEKVEAANAVSRLIEFNKADVVIGTYGSACAIPGSEVAQKQGVAMIGCSPTNPLVTVGKEYAFRVCFIDPFQGRVMAQFAYEELGAKNALIIQDIASDYSVGLAHFFQAAFQGKILETISYQTGDQDFTAQLTVASAKNPDVIFIPAAAYGDAALIIKQARELGMESTFLGGDTWEAPEFLEVGGAAVEGSYFSTHFDAEAITTEAAAEFGKAFQDKYGYPPSAFAALGYDAYMLAVDAVERAGSTDHAAIQAALAATDGFEGVTGVIALDENGDAVKDAVVKTIKGGEFKYIATVRPSK